MKIAFYLIIILLLGVFIIKVPLFKREIPRCVGSSFGPNIPECAKDTILEKILGK